MPTAEVPPIPAPPVRPTPSERREVARLYDLSRRAAMWGLAVTLSLGLLKLVGGWAGQSLALLSDAVHSLGDAIASASILLALRYAQQPADNEHPYGHTRVEAVAASSVAILLCLSGMWILLRTLGTWGEVSPSPKWFTIPIALTSVVLNEGLARYSLFVAKQTGSASVKASAWDQRLDAFGSGLVLLGLTVEVIGGPDWHWVDHVAALGVALIILSAAGNLFWSSMQELIDRQADPELLDRIRAIASGVKGVVALEKLLVRKSGLEYLVDLHLEVDPKITVLEGHAIGHAVKGALMAAIVTVRDVLVHIEPAE